ncbi:hypothetical protein CW670_10955 [Macrococcoides caseolyticum]|uniref:ArdC-like ssDNA-binding domain-containing protein n=1 Tax=Macrococcoides caseolyticum TaxID=69966 RepID=UPI000C336BA5|nr:ArdC-like ssDNA-binding domain-containing protein [Macrococcus caseolyticus]PKE73650.1 hypothetical protein CW670_10955 [Macrococcus caseolyticus]
MDRKEYAKNKQAEMNDFISKTITEIKKYFKDENSMKELGQFMSKMYGYSAKNQMLIASQYQGALYVGSEKHFNEKGFKIKEHEKPIQVLVPNSTKFFRDENGKTKPLRFANKFEKKAIKNKEIKVFSGKTYFKLGNVYDITQTNAQAKDYPAIYPNRKFDYKFDNKDYLNTIYDGARDYLKDKGINVIDNLHGKSNTFSRDLGAAKGYQAGDEIGLKADLTGGEKVKVLFHEIAHEILHKNITHAEYQDLTKRGVVEGEAEMTAYITSNHFGLDTSEDSFMYIKDWTKDFTLVDDKQINNFVQNVNKASRELIDNIESKLEIVNHEKAKEIMKNVEAGISTQELKDQLKGLYDGVLKNKVIEIATLKAYNDLRQDKGTLDYKDIHNPKLIVGDKTITADDVKNSADIKQDNTLDIKQSQQH